MAKAAVHKLEKRVRARLHACTSTSRRVLSGVVVNAASLVEYEEEGSCWAMHGNPISADSRLPKQHSCSPVPYTADHLAGRGGRIPPSTDAPAN